MKDEKTHARVTALSPTVLRLGLVSFFADVSSEMLYPITPIFLTTVLGASMLSVGVIEGFAEAVASLLKTYSGVWSDRIHKRLPFVWVGYFLAAVSKPITGISTSWLHVWIARSVDRTGKGLRTAPRDALLAESVSPKLRGAAFGWHRLMDTLGAAVGPLLAILFLSVDAENLRQLYFWALIPGLIAVLIVFSVREKKTQEISSAPKPRWSWGVANTGFKTYLAAWAVFSIANSSDVFLLLKSRSAGIDLKITILMYCFYNLVYALTSPYLGDLSDRIGRRRVLIGGLTVFSIVYAGFAFASHPLHYWLLFGVYGLYMAATDGVGKAFAIDLVPSGNKATAVGMLGTVTGIATLIASSAAGFLWDKVGSSTAFFYGSGGAILAIVILSSIKKEDIHASMAHS